MRFETCPNPVRGNARRNNPGCGCPLSEQWCRKMVHLSKEEFTWDETRTGSACASDLGYRAGSLPSTVWVARSEDDEIVETVIFHRDGQDRDAEGDLLVTRFTGVSHGQILTLQIFND